MDREFPVLGTAESPGKIDLALVGGFGAVVIGEAGSEAVVLGIEHKIVTLKIKA